MHLSDIIKNAQEIMDKHGNLECLNNNLYSVQSIKVVISKGLYPDDWNMPTGFKFVSIT